MKRILFNLLVSILALAGMGWSQTGVGGREVFYVKTFTTTGTKDTISIIGTGIVLHKMYWTGSGTRTTCTMKLEKSDDKVSWADLTSPIDCTSNSTYYATGQTNYVRFNVVTLSGTGNTINAVYDGAPALAPIILSDPQGNIVPSVNYGLGVASQVFTGTVSAGVTTTADIIVMPAWVFGYNWPTSVQVVNTSSTGVYGYICNGTCVTAGNRIGYFFAPPGASYVNMVPFRGSVNTNICVAAATGVTTLYASARGWVEIY